MTLMGKLYKKPTQTRRKNEAFPWLKIGINTFIFGGLVYLLVSFYPVLSVQASFYWNQWANKGEKSQYVTVDGPTLGDLVNAAPVLTAGPALPVTPVSTDFSVIIPKVDINAPIVADVNPADKQAYMKALDSGVAHALGTVKPGEVGNSYIFAHSTASIFNIERYAAVFTLLNRLEIGDRITTFYGGRRFDYKVSKKYIVDITNVTPLIATYDRPVLTLQTCDPPGTEFQRLIIQAEFIAEYTQ